MGNKKTTFQKFSKGFRFSMPATQAEKGVIICCIQGTYPMEERIETMRLC